MNKDIIIEFIKKHSDQTESSNKIGVAYPCIDELEVCEVLDSLLKVQLSQGPKVKQFESDFKSYVQTLYAVACNSGSSANLLALSSLINCGYLKPGDEVILPAATFTTVLSPILQCGLTPKFVDIELDTYNICPKSIEAEITEKTKLILVVHSLGAPANMNEIMKISSEYNIPVMEDCCEAHGASISDKQVGSWGLISTFSFFVAHNMTTGEGGMVLTNDENLYKNLTSIREFGRLKDYTNHSDVKRFFYNDGVLKNYDERYVFENIGYNLRMTDIAASIGIHQLRKLDLFNSIRRDNAKFLTDSLSEYKSIILPKTNGMTHAFYGYTVLIDDQAKYNRVQLVNYLESNNIETRAFMAGNLTYQPAYRFLGIKDFTNTNKLFSNAFFIGVHPFLSKNQLEYIVNTFKAFLNNYNV